MYCGSGASRGVILTGATKPGVLLDELQANNQLGSRYYVGGMIRNPADLVTLEK